MKIRIALISILATIVCFNANAQPEYTVEKTSFLCDAAKVEENYNTQFLRSNWQIVEGEDGWLFNHKRDFNEQFGFRDEIGLAEFKRFIDALEAHGTKLVMAYVPTRGLMNYQNTTAIDNKKHGELSDKYLEALSQFRELGVIVPDFKQVLGKQNNFYYKRDLHWTPLGAETTAKVVAEALIDKGLVEPVQKANYETRYDGLAGVDASIQVASEQLCGIELPVQYEKSYKTTRKLDSDNDNSLSLFGDDATKEIVLIGTSFSALEKFNFSGYLEQYLNTSVTNFAISGGQLTGAWIDYLKSGSLLESPPAIVIWEIPSYYKLDTQDVFSYLNPLFYGGCDSQPLVASQSNIAFKEGGIAQELLFNKGKYTTPSKELVLDVSFSDKEVRVLEATIWFGSGTNKTFRLKRNTRTKADGRFVFELGDHPMHGHEPIIAIDIDEVMMGDGEAAAAEDIDHLRADIKLCTIDEKYKATNLANTRHEN